MEIKNLMTIYREDKKSFWLKLVIMFTVALLAAYALGVYFAILENRLVASELTVQHQ